MSTSDESTTDTADTADEPTEATAPSREEIAAFLRDGIDATSDEVDAFAEFLGSVLNALGDDDDGDVPDPTDVRAEVPASVYGPEGHPPFAAKAFAATSVVPDDGATVRALISRIVPIGLLIELADEATGDPVGAVVVDEKALFSEVILAGLATLGRVGATAAERQAAVDRTNAATAAADNGKG